MGKPQTIAIVGAGIGGLAAAALLARAGHDVQVFDRFDAPRPVGSGLVIQPVGQAVLQVAGADVSGLGARIQRMSGIEVERGRTVLSVAYDRPGGGRHGLAIHRAALFQALHAAAVAAGARIIPRIEVLAAPLMQGGRGLTTRTGSLGPFDLVVDAGGVRSPLSPLTARMLPFGAVWGTVAWPADTGFSATELQQRYLRASHMVGVLPLGQRVAGGPDLAAVFWSLPVAALDRWAAVDIDAWKAEVLALWPEIAPFLTDIRSPADMTPARYSHGTLARPWGERLVHIGDAAHRASPQLGQGANMALLDALALAEAVAFGDDVGARYARARRWHVRLYQAFSAAFTPQYQSHSRWLPVIRDRVLMPVSRIPPVPRILTRLVAGDLIAPLAGVAFPPDARSVSP
ncbi:FAD-dependent monooxygenase [Tabrizicola sp.]|uniref:FAD-dependent oxidoreductase n=1 Tax=Tabrizicola sp. TaxID=2005166 RepID=UPI00286B134A|nr:FAD-dependent monooxygenase [Tabrizicola sp.]